MKKIPMSLMLMPLMAMVNVKVVDGVERRADGGPYTEIVEGIEWTFMVEGGKASVGCQDVHRFVEQLAVPQEITGAIEIPSTLGGCLVTSIGFHAFWECEGLTSVTIPEGVTSIGGEAFFSCSGLTSVTIPESVTSIGERAFSGCSGLTSVTIPSSVTSIGSGVFSGCSGLTSVTIPESVTSIGDSAFYHCSGLTSVTIPSSVTSIGGGVFSGCSGLTSVTIPSRVTDIGSGAFSGCSGLKDLYFRDEKPPVLGASVFDGCDPDLVLHAPKGWKGRTRILSGVYLEVEGEPIRQVNVTVTNVVVNYVLNSAQPEFAIPATSDTEFVNIITEVKGGAVAVPASWADNYPTFTTKFGSDFTKALAMKTGKKDGAGNDMFVWQDYVAGTDPTKEDDVFKASITIVDGKVTISYSPELDDERKAMRKYVTLGKRSLMDTDWTTVQGGHEAEYNFFKVSVEMK